MKTRIDLFKLHDDKSDVSLKKCIVAKGPDLNKKLAELIDTFDKTELVKNVMREFDISIASAERLVYLKRGWVPLFFVEYLLDLTHNQSLKYQFQDEIECLKTNQPPERVYKAVKFLSLEFCTLAGIHTADGTLAKDELIRITDNYEKNIDVLKGLIDLVFGIDVKKVKIVASSQEWGIEIKSKVIGRYLNTIFDFPYGSKQYTAHEPAIIKNSNLENRKAFALGALTFEAGIGMKHQIELCVVSKKFRDDISEILTLSNIKHNSMEKPSSSYWRLWSNKLTKEEAKKWMKFFAEGTDKWLLLKNYVDGFQGKTNSFEEAVTILNKVYPPKSSSKVCLKDVLEIISDVGEVHRYQLVDLLCQRKGLKSYGGTWAHSLKHYLDILNRAHMISVEKRKFGQKKSWGSIVREVYVFNTDLSSWRLP